MVLPSLFRADRSDSMDRRKHVLRQVHAGRICGRGMGDHPYGGAFRRVRDGGDRGDGRDMRQNGQTLRLRVVGVHPLGADHNGFRSLPHRLLSRTTQGAGGGHRHHGLRDVVGGVVRQRRGVQHLAHGHDRHYQQRQGGHRARNSGGFSS